MSKLLKTYKQTAEIHYNFSNLVFTSIEERPVPPYDLLTALEKTGKPQGYYDYTREGNFIMWFPDGKVNEYCSNCVKIFYPKPTLEDAIKYKGKGFWKFNSDGTVILNAFDNNYIYFPDVYERSYYHTFYTMLWNDEINDYETLEETDYNDDFLTHIEGIAKKIEARIDVSPELTDQDD